MGTAESAAQRGIEPRTLTVHSQMLRRYLFVLGAPAAGIEDLLQEVFVLAMRQNFHDGGPRAVGALLRGIGRNLLLRARRAAAARREVELAHEVWCEDGGDDDGDERVEALRACVAALPPRARTLLELAYGEGLGRAALAQAIGMQPDGVKTALRRLREGLRACIARKRGTS